MSDTLEKIDRFESMFRRAEKPVFTFEDVGIERILIVTDLEAEAADLLVASVRPMLDMLIDPEPVQWRGIGRADFADMTTLRELIESIDPDLIVTYRNLFHDADAVKHSLGAFVDEITQVIPVPVLLLPGHGTAPTDRIENVMVVTNHLTGDRHLVSEGVRFTRDGGTLILCHVEDDATYERYMMAIERIPDINSDVAREQIVEQLLKQPSDYIATCAAAIGESRRDIQIESEVLLGHSIRDYARLLDEHEVDLLVLNTKDEQQIAMHGMAYSIAVEFRRTPLLLL